jgi:hypothetical protein
MLVNKGWDLDALFNCTQWTYAVKYETANTKKVLGLTNQVDQQNHLFAVWENK